MFLAIDSAMAAASICRFCCGDNIFFGALFMVVMALVVF